MFSNKELNAMKIRAGIQAAACIASRRVWTRRPKTEKFKSSMRKPIDVTHEYADMKKARKL